MGATMGKSGGNFLDALPTQGTLHVVMLGLDSAGKTTALYRLKFDQYLNTVPTIGFNCEKVQGTVGKAKGVQFLVWDVGGQEKLRPLWRSYTRCTDGILFVVDSVDVERMEEAKMELMRTAKCPDNQGVPVLILANKQDLPGAREPKELEKLLGLHELSPMYPTLNLKSMSSSSSSTGNIVGGSSSSSTHTHGRSLTPSSQHNKSFTHSAGSSSMREQPTIQYNTLSSSATTLSSTSTTMTTEHQEIEQSKLNYHQHKHMHGLHQEHIAASLSSPSSAATTPTTNTSNQILTGNKTNSMGVTAPAQSQTLKGWYIQPACAITGEGLQEGLEALHEMIVRRRKMNKAHKKKR